VGLKAKTTFVIKVASSIHIACLAPPYLLGVTYFKPVSKSIVYRHYPPFFPII